MFIYSAAVKPKSQVPFNVGSFVNLTPDFRQTRGRTPMSEELYGR